MRRRHSYIQTGIGACGHIVEMWPLIHPIGSNDYQAICDTCTRARFAIPDGDDISVWVLVRDREENPYEKMGKERKKKQPEKDPLSECLF